MKWGLLVVGALVVVVCLIALVGALLPRDHVAAVSITLRQPAESVWKVVRDLGGVPRWWAAMRRSERSTASDGREHWKQAMGGFEMQIVVETDAPPTTLVTRIESPPGAAFGGAWTYQLAPTPDGCRVTLTERGWVANPIFRFLSRFVFGYYGSLERYLLALGKQFGEVVKPVREP